MSPFPAAREPLRFRIESAFTLTGRGTVVLGEIEAGEVRVGDALRVAGTDVTFTCAGISAVRTTDARPLVGLLTSPGLEPAEFPPGSVIRPA